ncbi:MAG: molecular chaperone HtpG [Candidatus Sulcia muelleri]|uniref:Chaperone protein HtpG (HSP90) n=1 Tax=Karelsulcia muelleri (strain GWSS) TaxID=444179 RepID=A8Z5Z3_KARMG|nr:chaperone protein HtpG (HSP90) [Candidatus Karelsulcia muelleri GWSS]MBS0018884.1 molecular chaperone HtpG [Candidatus Karelsulcia muelleri]MCJ7422426.1 molecular chaperone HtpG [Candidatus Karelsulcia muelleri]MCJ7468733.1 molecular chaperone HtpG [Candidatus Karelsulcia muelleri]
MEKGKIKVTVEDIFPVIKKFLYSDNEIFIRELVSNATDAILKLKTLINLGKFNKKIDDLIIEIVIDKENKILKIIDNGIGMTKKEVKKYINQIAFSGAEEFLRKYKDKNNEYIIGHFGLGFYSSFMVSDKVEIISKSYKDYEDAIHWICDGTTNFSIKNIDNPKSGSGTEIILHINDSSKEFLEENKIKELLIKYCKFMPIPIKLGEREVNNPYPIWVKNPINVKDEEYINFYKELYPMQIADPLFWIHLNIDHPFKLTGVLFFPKIKNKIEIQRDKIQLYKNKVYVTDNLEGIVPDFLNLLKGVIDSPDIPLNVSRSYLQSDSSVKQISGYITRKVAEKLENMCKNNREDFEKNWEDIKIIIEYGMISDSNFYSKAKKFALYPDINQKYFLLEEYIKKANKFKNNKIICFYTSNIENQNSYIETIKNKGYKILLLDSPIVGHLLQKIEMDYKNINFFRVDSDQIDKILKNENENENIYNLSKEETNILENILKKNIDNNKFLIKIEDLSDFSLPFIITVPEFIRRMKEISMTGNNMFNINNINSKYNLIVNKNHKLIKKIINEKDLNLKKNLIKNSLHLIMLSQNLLKGKELTDFIYNSFEMLSK